MMDINTLASKVGGEIVGGRLVAVVDGKKAYLTNVGEGGKPFLNELGLRISNEMSHLEAPAPAPKRGRRKAEPVESPVVESVDDPLDIELDV